MADIHSSKSAETVWGKVHASMDAQTQWTVNIVVDKVKVVVQSFFAFLNDLRLGRHLEQPQKGTLSIVADPLKEILPSSEQQIEIKKTELPPPKTDVKVSDVIKKFIIESGQKIKVGSEFAMEAARAHPHITTALIAAGTVIVGKNFILKKISEKFISPETLHDALRLDSLPVAHPEGWNLSWGNSFSKFLFTKSIPRLESEFHEERPEFVSKEGMERDFWDIGEGQAELDQYQADMAKEAHSLFLADVSKKHFNPAENEDWSLDAVLAPEETSEWAELAENNFTRSLSGHADTIFGSAKKDLASYAAMKSKLAKNQAIDQYAIDSLQKIEREILKTKEEWATFLADTSKKHFNSAENEDWASESTPAPEGMSGWTYLVENNSVRSLGGLEKSLSSDKNSLENPEELPKEIKNKAPLSGVTWWNGASLTEKCPPLKRENLPLTIMGLGFVAIQQLIANGFIP
jgi:hypothetical protein